MNHERASAVVPPDSVSIPLRQDVGPDSFPQRAHAAAAAKPQQLVARIKRSSKYYGQTAPGAWFDVRVVEDRFYSLRGNDNNYRMSDVAFGIRTESGKIVEIKS